MSKPSSILRSGLVASLVSATLALAAFSPAQAEENLYFYVKNRADSRIVKLQVSENRKNWGDFDIGRGIAPGQKVKLIWDPSTDDESCKQWIRAKFADGSTSDPSKFDFCDDFDDPIEFW